MIVHAGIPVTACSDPVVGDVLALIEKHSVSQSGPHAVHSTDFRFVDWFGEKHSVTARQAAAVRVLWEDWKKGAPDVGQEILLAEARLLAKRLHDDRFWIDEEQLSDTLNRRII